MVTAFINLQSLTKLAGLRRPTVFLRHIFLPAINVVRSVVSLAPELMMINQMQEPRLSPCCAARSLEWVGRHMHNTHNKPHTTKQKPD